MFGQITYFIKEIVGRIKKEFIFVALMLYFEERFREQLRGWIFIFNCVKRLMYEDY